jgi:hypothetical protein
VAIRLQFVRARLPPCMIRDRFHSHATFYRGVKCHGADSTGRLCVSTSSSGRNVCQFQTQCLRRQVVPQCLSVSISMHALSAVAGLPSVKAPETKQPLMGLQKKAKSVQADAKAAVVKRLPDGVPTPGARCSTPWLLSPSMNDTHNGHMYRNT